MPVPSFTLKERLAKGEQLTGCLLRMPAEETVEMLALAGFDFILIDCEHGPADVVELRQHIALIQLHGMAPVVRVGLGEHALILRALDQGAEGIVAPHIDTVEEARNLVRAAHYPPLGERGFATYSRAGGFGLVDPSKHREKMLNGTLLIAMLESPKATQNAAEILECEGIDGYLIGTADLRASIGERDQPFSDSISSIRLQAGGTGAFRADLASSFQDAQKAFADGAQLVVYNLAHIMMHVFQGLLPANNDDEDSTSSGAQL